MPSVEMCRRLMGSILETSQCITETEHVNGKQLAVNYINFTQILLIPLKVHLNPGFSVDNLPDTSSLKGPLSPPHRQRI